MYQSPNRAGEPLSSVSSVLHLSFYSSSNWVALKFILCGFILHFQVLRLSIGTFMYCWERWNQGSLARQHLKPDPIDIRLKQVQVCIVLSVSAAGFIGSQSSVTLNLSCACLQFPLLPQHELEFIKSKKPG